jgi:hypothetical protein
MQRLKLLGVPDVLLLTGDRGTYNYDNEKDAMMKSIRSISTLGGRRYWMDLLLVAVVAFGVSRIVKRASDASLARIMNQRVLAAGPLPSFELSRTERLTSERIHDKVTIVTTVARRGDGAKLRSLKTG